MQRRGWQQAPPCLLQPTPNPGMTTAVSAAHTPFSKPILMLSHETPTNVRAPPGPEQASRKQAAANPPPKDVLSTLRCLRCLVESA